MSEKQIIGIRFQDVGKLYHFDAGHVDDLKPGDFAVVRTSRGDADGAGDGICRRPAQTAARHLEEDRSQSHARPICCCVSRWPSKNWR